MPEPTADVHQKDLEISPYQRALGLQLVEVSEGEIRVRLPFRDDFLRVDGSDWLHGGVVSALIDVVVGWAAYTAVKEHVATADLRIDLVRPARGDLEAVGVVRKIGGRLCVVDAEVRDAGGKVVALGRGTVARPGRRGSFEGDKVE